MLDAAVLYKAGWDAYCDIIIFVDADAAMRAARARQRGWSDEQWQAREAAQPPLACSAPGRCRAGQFGDARAARGAGGKVLAIVTDRQTRATNFREPPFTKSPENP